MRAIFRRDRTPLGKIPSLTAFQIPLFPTASNGERIKIILITRIHYRQECFKTEWIATSKHCKFILRKGQHNFVLVKQVKKRQRQRQRQTERFSDLVAKLSDKLRNSIMTYTISDWQSESDLDSIRDSCDVLSVFFIVVVSCRQDIFISQCWKVFKWPICCAV